MGIKLILFSKMSKPHWHMERRIELNATSGCEKKSAVEKCLSF